MQGGSPGSLPLQLVPVLALLLIGVLFRLLVIIVLILLLIEIALIVLIALLILLLAAAGLELVCSATCVLRMTLHHTALHCTTVHHRAGVQPRHADASPCCTLSYVVELMGLRRTVRRGNVIEQ